MANPLEPAAAVGDVEVKRLPVSALVVSHNEARLLEDCLPPLGFCDQVVVVDLASQDATAAVARSHGADVVEHRFEPFLEVVQHEVVPLLAHSWVLLPDPDEVVPTALADELARLGPSLDDRVGIVLAPLQYRFAGRPLRGTVWGGVKWKRLLVHRGRVVFSDKVHKGAELRPGFTTTTIPANPENVIAHRWASSWRQLIRKHRRYLPEETRRRLEDGELSSWKLALATPGRSFLESYFRQRGYRDGWVGFGLSLIWAWYTAAIELGVRLEQGRRG